MPNVPTTESSRTERRTEDGSIDIIGTLRATLPPGRGFLVLFGVGLGVEMFGIAWANPNLYRTDRGTILFGLLFQLWFWATATWLAYFAGRKWRDACIGKPRWQSTVLTTTVAGCLSLAVTSYATSWGLFFRTGRFANLETGRFVLFNTNQLWIYLVQAEPLQLITIVAVLAGSALVIPSVLWWSVGEAVASGEAAPRRNGVTISAWMALTMAMLTSWNHLPDEPSWTRRSARQHVLKHALNPGFTLYASHLEARINGDIPPDLDEATLIPLRSTGSEALPVVADRNEADWPRPSVILIAIESLRHDTIQLVHQGREVLPHVNELASNGWHMTRAYAQSTHSDYADVCLVSSLYPLRMPRHHYYGPADPWPKTLIYDVLKPLGYQTAIISSQNEAWGGMDKFLVTDHLDTFLHPETLAGETVVSDKDVGFSREIALGGLVAGKFHDDFTTTQAISWIEQQASARRPFFLSINFQSSHFPYLMPSSVPRPFQPAGVPDTASFVSYPIEDVECVRNAYFNAIHECDRNVGRIVECLRQLGQLENTLIIVTGENGEAFHECGSVNHAREPVDPAIHIAWVMHAPNYLQPRREDYPCEHVDLTPTILSLVGAPLSPNYQGINLLADDRPDPESRLTFCHVLNDLAHCDAVMLGGRWKLTVDRRTGAVTLVDTQTDPDESTNLFSKHAGLAEQLLQTVNRWRARQLAYYHYPSFYMNYFPPQPPRWNSSGLTGQPGDDEGVMRRSLHPEKPPQDQTW